MTHVPFTSRLASLIRLPSSNPSSKYGGGDDDDEYYIPYTGTYEPPPHSQPPPVIRNPTPPAGAAASSSSHTYVRTTTHTHAHTHSGTTKVSNTQTSSYSGHPYNPDNRFFFAHHVQQPSSSTHLEESERGRKPPPPRRVSNSSSFAALALDHHGHGTGTGTGTGTGVGTGVGVGMSFPFPKHPTSSSNNNNNNPNPTLTLSTTVQPNPNARRGGPSYLALDGGFIGHSPVATIPPHAHVHGGESSRGGDGAGHRGSFASFITFGGSRKSTAAASTSASVSASASASVRGWPHSASATTFPHAASKIRGERRPSAVEFEYASAGSGGGDDTFSRPHPHPPHPMPMPMPPYIRPRSRSYVDQTELPQEGWLRRSESESEERERRTRRGVVGEGGKNSVKVTMPTSFFDVEDTTTTTHPSALALGARSNLNQGHASTAPHPHPYHRHYHPPQPQHGTTTMDPLPPPPRDMHGNVIDLSSPTAPTFDFYHPYATAPPTSTSTSNPSNPSNLSKARHTLGGGGTGGGIRPLIIPRKPVPDFHERQQHESDRERDDNYYYQRERDNNSYHRERPSPGVFPFVNPFSFASNNNNNSSSNHHSGVYTPPTTRPATPKGGRLKSLVSLGEGLRALKGSISTPNLRASAVAAAAARAHNQQQQQSVTGGGGTQLSHSTRHGTTVPAEGNNNSNSRRPSSSRTIPPNSILQGQTLCDTFFLPRPRFHAHQISPPDSPNSPVLIREPTSRQHRTAQTKPNAGEVAEALREWNRRGTTGTMTTGGSGAAAAAAAAAAMTRSDPGAERRERERERRLGKKKASAPDLRRRPDRPAVLVRRLTEAEKVLLRGEEQEREREEWQRTAQGSFQNRRSRSLSRTRTKSIAKGSASGDEREKEKGRVSRKNTTGGGGGAPSSVAITVTVTTNPGTAPPTATSSSGPATSGDESRSNPRERDAQHFGVKTSMEYLATRAFSQGHTSVAPAPSSSGHSHSRHHSGDTNRDRHHRDKSKNQSLSHRRSESWGRTALKLARNSCADPNATSPAIETVYQPGIDDAPQVVVVGTKISQDDDTILDIGPNKLDDRPPSDDLHWRPSAIGIAIGTPPLDSLLNEASNRIEHPYSTPLPSPIFVGPHPASPINSLPTLPIMSDVVSRHRLPPRANTAFSPPRSPDAGMAGLDAYVPTMEGSSQAVLSRESWLVYMNSPEEGESRPRTTDKGKGRAMEQELVIYEERPSRDVPVDVDVTMDTPELQLNLGLDGSPGKSMRSRIISAQDMEAQLTRAFRRQSAASMSGSSENEHAALTFEAGATLSRLLSSRSVTSTPRSGSTRRRLSNPGTPKMKKMTMAVDPDDPQSTLTQAISMRPPIPIFEPMTHHRSSSGGASRRVSGHSDAALSASGPESLWRKSILSSEVAAHSPPSQESSPKASPRTLVNLDDLEGYSDLFYTGGHGSLSSRPKSGGSSKTTTSSGLLERALRPEMVTFGSKGSSVSSAAERSHPTSDPARAAGGLSPPPPRAPPRMIPADSAEASWRASGPAMLTEAELERTWDPEEDEDEEDSYRIGDTRQPIVVRATLPVHRHSTKLSVIEGSVDEHATASESTADPEDQESMPATSPTRATIPGAPHNQAFGQPPLAVDTLAIPHGTARRTSSEGAVVPDEYARTSMLTNTSGQSRMSGLSDFPVPPIESAAFAPSDAVQSYLPPRSLSPVPPASPASVLSVEPPSPVAEPDEGEDRSVSEHHHAFGALAGASTPVREYRSNRATFGPDADIARQWAEREHSSTPTTEED